MSNPERTDSRGYIQNGQLLKKMREQIENKSLLPEYGDMYIGTGKKTELGTPITTTLKNPFGQTNSSEFAKYNMKLVCDEGDGNQNFGGVAWKDVFDGHMTISNITTDGNVAYIKVDTDTSLNQQNINKNKIFPTGEIYLNVGLYGGQLVVALRKCKRIYFELKNDIKFVYSPLDFNGSMSNYDILAGNYVQSTTNKKEFVIYFTENMTQHYSFLKHYSKAMGDAYEVVAFSGCGVYTQSNAQGTGYSQYPINQGWPIEILYNIDAMLSREVFQTATDLSQLLQTATIPAGTVDSGGWPGEFPERSTSYLCGANIIKCYKLKYVPGQGYQRYEEEDPESFECAYNLTTQHSAADIGYDNVSYVAKDFAKKNTVFMFKKLNGEYSEPTFVADPELEDNRCVKTAINNYMPIFRFTTTPNR